MNNHFGQIHTLEAGDTITLTTLLGTRTYSVVSMEKVSVNDSSDTAPTTDNRVTLYTCVMNQPEYRWKVAAVRYCLAERSSHKVTLDGVPVAVEVYNINGSNYFQLQDLARLLDVGVEWNSVTRTVEISTDAGHTEEPPGQAVSKPSSGAVGDDLYDIRVEIVERTKSHGLLEDDAEEVLDCYFRACSIRVDCKALAHIAAVLSNRGRLPASNERIFPAAMSRYVNAILMTCGMCDGSGEFALRVGVPAKSGVGGGIMAVVPTRMGIGIYGPALDPKGNSIAGIRLLEQLSREPYLSIF